jgi:hypothetical protein
MNTDGVQAERADRKLVLVIFSSTRTPAGRRLSAG